MKKVFTLICLFVMLVAPASAELPVSVMALDEAVIPSVLVVAAVAPEGWGIAVIPRGGWDWPYQTKVFIKADGYGPRTSTQGAAIVELPPGASFVTVGPWYPLFPLGTGWHRFTVEFFEGVRQPDQGCWCAVTGDATWVAHVEDGGDRRSSLPQRVTFALEEAVVAMRVEDGRVRSQVQPGDQLLQIFRWMGLNPLYMLGTDVHGGGITYGFEDPVWVLAGTMEGGRIEPAVLWTEWAEYAKPTFFANRAFADFRIACSGPDCACDPHEIFEPGVAPLPFP